MNAQGSQLAQIRPASTSAVLAYENVKAPSGQRPNAEVTLIMVCNTTNAPTACSIFHDSDGQVYTEATALYFGKTVPANDSIILPAYSQNAGISVVPGGSIGVKSSVADALTFSIYGVTAQTALRQSP